MKAKVYKMVVGTVLVYVSETRRRDEELEVAEMKMLGFYCGVIRVAGINNESLTGTAHIRWSEKPDGDGVDTSRGGTGNVSTAGR